MGAARGSRVRVKHLRKRKQNHDQQTQQRTPTPQAYEFELHVVLHVVRSNTRKEAPCMSERDLGASIEARYWNNLQRSIPQVLWDE